MGRGWGGIIWEFEIDMYTLLDLKWITKKDLLEWHMKLCSMLNENLDGRAVQEKMDTCIYMAESLLFSPETITTLFVNQLYLNTKQKIKKKRSTNYYM